MSRSISDIGLSDTRVGSTIRLLILGAILLLALYPMVFIVTTSLKDPSQVSTGYFTLQVSEAAIGNYSTATAIVLPLILNSAIVTLQTLVINLVVGFSSAYVFALQRFRGKNVLFSLTTISLMVPGIMIFVPSYLLVRDLGLLGSSWSMSLPFAAQTIAVTAYLLRSYLLGLPFEIVEAARVDGAGELRIASRIIFPMAAPIVVSASVINVLFTWNQFLWPLVVSSTDTKTVPVGLALLQTQFGNELPTIMAGYLIASLPLVLVFCFGLKYLISGVTSGAIK